MSDYKVADIGLAEFGRKELSSKWEPVLFGASIVILAISIYMATAKITKKSIHDREIARLMDMEINHLHDRIDDLERRSQTGTRLLEKMLSDIITGTNKYTP